MKQINNRQNKFIPVRTRHAHSFSGRFVPDPYEPHGHDAPKSGTVFGLVSDLLLASKIAQTAKHHNIGVHNFDKSGPLIVQAKEKAPILVLLDWDKCEAEAFKVLKEFAAHADLKSVPTVGYLTHGNEMLKNEALRAGCHRVYGKTEFGGALDDLLMRFAQ